MGMVTAIDVVKDGIGEPNWTVVYILTGIIAVVLLLKHGRMPRALKGVGMTNQNVLRLSLFKNYINSLPDEERIVFEALIDDLRAAEPIHSKIAALQMAITKLDAMQVKIGEPETDEGRYHRIVGDLEAENAGL